MAERNVERIVADCERYWRSTGVSDSAVAEMRVELESHLREAERAGKSPASVVGEDLAEFAEEWAAAHRGPVTHTVTDTRRDPDGGNVRWLWLTIGIIAVAFALAAIVAPKEDTVDAENWQWIWVGAAVLLGIGELLTAGFFLLPFAVGAAAAAVLAFLGVGVAVQLLTFVIVSVMFLAVLQRYARQERETELTRVGAVRYAGRTAMVLEPVNRLSGSGSVRMDTEDWRATTDLDTEIPVGVEVQVIEVRGTRLVVEPIEPGSAEL